MATDRALTKLVDRTLERIVVASVPLCTDETARALVDVLSHEDFDDGEARLYWRCIEELVAERGGWIQLEWLLDRAERSMSHWQQFHEGVSTISYRQELSRNAEMVADLAAKRRILLTCRGGISLVESEVPPEDIVHTLQDHLLEVRSVVPDVPYPRTLRDAITTPTEQRFDWAVDGWLERKDRVIVTGAEGKGKATLLRQFLIQMGIGFHPWRGPDQFEPMIGLYVDLQDGTRRNEREFAVIAERAGVDPFDHLYMESRNSGVNVVRNASDRRWLEALIRKCQPRVVALGPLSRLISGEDRTDAVPMQSLMAFIDRMRDRYDLIWLLEAHAAKAQGGSQRSWVPFGSQAFMEWPDVGIGVSPIAKTNPPRANLIDWRGNRDVLTKVWPQRVVWGEHFPWVPSDVVHPMLRHRAKVVNIPVQEEPGGRDDDGPPERDPF